MGEIEISKRRPSNSSKNEDFQINTAEHSTEQLEKSVKFNNNK